VLAVAVVALVVLVCLEDDPPPPAPDPDPVASCPASQPDTGPNQSTLGPNQSTVPTPTPATDTSTQSPECEEMIQDIRDAIDRDKGSPDNLAAAGGTRSGMHGVRARYYELIYGPCGPGQRPYRYNPKTGAYAPQSVWENHVEAFRQTQSALRNRVYKAIEAGCTIPDDLLDAAADAEGMDPPTPDQWVGDPNRPCKDSDPPEGWYGPPEPPSTRGL
jgi:hypothetical protein